MILSKLLHQKIPLFSVFFFCLIGLGLVIAKPVFADVSCNPGQCQIRHCINDEGCADPGAVMQCIQGGFHKCDNGNWRPLTPEEIANGENQQTPALIHYTPFGMGSLERFQSAVLHCAQSGELNLECHTGGGELMETGASSGIITNIFNSLSTAIIGPATPELMAMTENPPPSVAQTTTNLIAGMYARPPASSKEYLADLGRNLGIVPKPAYAQGVGFIGLNPVLELWKRFRNFAYLLFVIVFVIIGFAIMFRVKIDPQTVITIQTALPRVVMALILVTFSYAIAGFMIDLVYVFISLIFHLLGVGVSTLNVQQNIFSIAGQIFGGIGGISLATNLGSQINDMVQQIFAGFEGNIFGFAVSALATAVFAIAIAFSLFRLFFSLLISYVGIIVGVIFSPLILVLEAVPGQRGLGSWMRLMLSNIIVFPVTAGILAIASFLTREVAPGGRMWVAPFLGVETVEGTFIPTLIAIGILLMAPSLVDQVKKAIGAPGIGAGVMAPVAAGWGVIAAGPQAFWRQTGGAIAEEARKRRAETFIRGSKLPTWFKGKEPPTSTTT